ncbi:MAG: glycosyltransferase [Patescibacteria group bacterium]
MRVALVYDRINKFGGAERVLMALHEIWPEAPLFTSVYDFQKADWANGWDIRTSWLQNVPGAKINHEFFGWMMPLVFEPFDFSEFDVVISVTSESAKGIITGPKQLHICYLLTPTRYLWSHANDYLNIVPGLLRPLAGIFQSKLRIWDYMAAQRPDYILSISKLVQSRCWKYYRRESEVVRPMLELDIKRPGLLSEGRALSNKEYFLVVSRLVPYKRIDLAIEACNKLKLPLVVVGTGSEEKNLKKLAGPTIRFTGYLTDRELIEYYRNAKAFIMPQEEDFGLTAVEALSLGIPVISYKWSGAAEIVKDGETGILFEKQSVDSLINGLKKFDKLAFRDNYFGLEVSGSKFREEFKVKINKLWIKHQTNIYSR